MTASRRWQRATGALREHVKTLVRRWSSRIASASDADWSARLRLATEAAHVGTWAYDPKTGTLHWDALCKQIQGFSADVEITFDTFLASVHAEDREAVRQLVQQALDPAGSGEYRCEYRILSPGGGERWIEAHGRMFFGPGRRAGQMFGVTIDVTDRKRVEARLAEDARFRERFMGILGHDLRTPLTSIAFATAALLARTDLPPDATANLRRIATSAERMARLVRDMLDVTRIRLGGGIPIAPTAADLHDICQQIVDELRIAHPQRTIVCATRGSGRGVWDVDRLAQAVSNVLGNALVYSPPDTPVNVTVDEHEKEVVLAVHNDGPPIPPAMMATLFDPFRRGDRASNGAHPATGLGLGLFICQQIVHAHGGTIDVMSAPGHGTTVTISLPRVRLAGV
jgi:PAS domain S-box-containing protein